MGAAKWNKSVYKGHDAVCDNNGSVFITSASTIHKISNSGGLAWTSTVPGIENTFDARVTDPAGNFWGFEIQEKEQRGSTNRSIVVHKIDGATGKELIKKAIAKGMISSEKTKGTTTDVSYNDVYRVFDPVAVGGKIVFLAGTDFFMEKISPTLHKLETSQSIRAYVIDATGKSKMTEFASKAFAYVNSSTEKGKHSYAEGSSFCNVLGDRDIYFTAGVGIGKTTASSLNSPEFRAGGSSQDGVLLKFDVSTQKFTTVRSYPNHGPQVWGSYIGDGHFLMEDRAPAVANSSWNIIDLAGNQTVPANDFTDFLINPILGTSTSHSLFNGINGTHYARLVKYDFSALLSKSAIPQVTAAAEMPTEFRLEQNYPNPFNPTTAIRFSLPIESQVQLTVYNTLGQLVAGLIDGIQTAGEHSISWDATNFSSGVYLYRIEAIGITDGSKTFRSVGKMILTK